MLIMLTGGQSQPDADRGSGSRAPWRRCSRWAWRCSSSAAATILVVDRERRLLIVAAVAHRRFRDPVLARRAALRRLGSALMPKRCPPPACGSLAVDPKGLASRAGLPSGRPAPPKVNGQELRDLRRLPRAGRRGGARDRRRPGGRPCSVVLERKWGRDLGLECEPPRARRDLDLRQQVRVLLHPPAATGPAEEPLRQGRRLPAVASSTATTSRSTDLPESESRAHRRSASLAALHLRARDRSRAAALPAREPEDHPGRPHGAAPAPGGGRDPAPHADRALPRVSTTGRTSSARCASWASCIRAWRRWRWCPWASRAIATGCTRSGRSPREAAPTLDADPRVAGELPRSASARASSSRRTSCTSRRAQPIPAAAAYEDFSVVEDGSRPRPAVRGRSRPPGQPGRDARAGAASAPRRVVTGELFGPILGPSARAGPCAGAPGRGGRGAERVLRPRDHRGRAPHRAGRGAGPLRRGRRRTWSCSPASR